MGIESDLDSRYRRPEDKKSDRGARRPVAVSALSIFFALGAAMAFIAAVSLIFPDSPLEPMWRLNPRARASFRDLGFWSAALMLAASSGCAVSAIGLWRGSRWGHIAALSMLAISLVGDVLNVALGTEPRAVVGIPIVGVLITYLLTRSVRSFFAHPKTRAMTRSPGL